MKARRILLVCALTLLMVLSALPSAEARYCADAYARCQTSCNQTFGGGFLGSIMAAGCGEGCAIGYIYCASGT